MMENHDVHANFSLTKGLHNDLRNELHHLLTGLQENVPQRKENFSNLRQAVLRVAKDAFRL